MCYSGDRKNATAYFKDIGFECPPETNPAEYFIDLVTIDTDDAEKAVADAARIDFLHHHFLETCTSIIHDDDNAGAWTPPQSGFTRQKTSNDGNPFSLSFVIHSVTNTIHRFAALLQRSLRQNIRNSRVNILRLSTAVMQAVLFSAIFKSVREGKFKRHYDVHAAYFFAVDCCLLNLKCFLPSFGIPLCARCRQINDKKYC